MNYRLTLKPNRQPDQAAGSEDQQPFKASSQRQPWELQSAFLTDMLDKMVTVYLVSGIKLTGMLKQFDQFTLLLQGADGIESLIFKHATSTVTPGVPIVSRERRTPFGKRPERVEWSTHPAGTTK